MTWLQWSPVSFRTFLMYYSGCYVSILLFSFFSLQVSGVGIGSSPPEPSASWSPSPRIRVRVVLVSWVVTFLDTLRGPDDPLLE